MVRPKAPAKKQQKKAIDFKKIKRKLGRKLPPPKNATNTEIKSKAIILPEQSVGAEKSGIATSKKGLTLKELLQQTSHHNPKVRKDALLGIKDLFKHYPAEMQSHKYAIIQKLRERVTDDDKLVRDAFYKLFEADVFPACIEDNLGPMVSLLMPYIFSAMADSSIDVRLMAFKFFHLVVKNYPPTFSLYAEKILENYTDIIQKNHFYVQDKSKLKVALSGLEHCLSLLPCDESDTESQKKGHLQKETLLAYEQDVAEESVRFAHVSEKLKEIVGVLINCFQDFIPLIRARGGLDEASFDCINHILCGVRYAIKFSNRMHIPILDQETASMLLKKLLGSFPLNPENNLSGKVAEWYFILNSVLTEIFLEVSGWSLLPWDISCRYLKFIDNTLRGKFTRSIGESIHKKTLLALVPFVPKLILRVEDREWRDNFMQAFTIITLSDCEPESPLKLALRIPVRVFISVVRDLIIPNGDILYLNDPTVNNDQLAWVDELPSLLTKLGNKHLVSTQQFVKEKKKQRIEHAISVVLQLLIDLGRVGCVKKVLIDRVRCLQNAPSTFKEDTRKFFNPYQEEGAVEPGGPFARLPRKIQELALCFLYYFTIDNFSPPMQRAIVSCCLYPQLKPAVLYRIVEVLHTAYRDGYIQITDHLSFFITLIARFRESIEYDGRRETTFQALTNLVCSCLSEMGDSSLVLQILEKVFVEQIILKPALVNGCGILRMICTLDSIPTRLSESSVTALSEFLPGYLIDIVNCIPEDKEKLSYLYIYYLVPCFHLFDRSSRLTEDVLKRMRLMVSENTRAMLESSVQQDGESSRNSVKLIQCIVSVILLMHNDVKARKIISPFKSEIDLILQNLVTLQSSSLTVEGKHMMKIAGERLRIASNSLLSCTTVTML
uniref:Testis-expressed sequence 10 protein-like protein n=1 Tax=Noccaea caerulescens TaxID=107243 RepID=A0A1J3JH12_NOCCA